MAKLENEEGKLKKKSNGKKRKHVTAESEDEVASKSLIVDKDQNMEAEADIPKKKAAKRKNKIKSEIKEKRNKKTDDECVGTDDDEYTAKEATMTDSIDKDAHLHEPTLEELRECEKPENTNAVVTVRQKKKQKHQQRLSEQKEHLGDKETKRNEEYLQKWKHTRAEWKFEKLRQISIQQTIFDEHKINAETWPLALEYLSGSKGAAKDKLCKLAEEIIDQLDKKCEQQNDDDERQAIVDSAKYQRARDLLQSFD